MKYKITIHPLWYICIIIRIIISILPLIYNYFSKYKIINIISQINKYIILLIGFGFLYKTIFGSNNEIQIKKVFWHNTRIIHALLFIIAGLYFKNYKISSVILLIDVLFSILYRLLNGHFN